MAVYPEDREAWTRDIQSFLRDPLKGRSGLQGWYSSAQYQRELDRAAADRIDELEDRLRAIGEFAHDHSTGPAVPDRLWTVRGMAYEQEAA